MEMTKKEAHDLLEQIWKTESKLVKWRKLGVGLVMTKELYDVLNASTHSKKDFILQGVVVERRGKLRF